MWEIILLMRQDQYIIMKKNIKGHIWNCIKKRFKRTQEEGIDAQMIPWIDDKKN